uniref:Putative transposase (Putative), gypsy type n=1 Tax=Helianthus annuus TaxID=4232 RepID=A0A251TRA1_HELAN
MAEKNPTQKKRKHRGRAPPGPDQAVINWKEEEFQMLVRGMNFRSEWGAQYPPPGSTALDAPPGFITLYVAYFREGNFRLPITKFTAAVLRGYGLHISQINAIGLPRITHFEFACRSYRVDPTFEMFNVFYSVTYTSGFYSFQARSGVAPVCSVLLKGIHDWKQKFFYIRRGVIPTDMLYRQVSQGIPKVDVLPNYGAQDWYKRITAKPTAISQLDEMALVGAGMSLLWVPKHPLGQPAYSHKGKFGYSLLNALDPKSAGAMVEAIQADGHPTWLEQIRGRFLHPTDESLSRYADEVLGEDVWDDFVDWGREEVIVLSSGSSDPNVGDLTSHYARAGTAPGGVADPVHEIVGDDDDAEASVDPSAQLETRKKARTDKSGRREEKPESKGAGSSRVGEKSQQSDPDDGATLSEHMKKKALDDHKRRLDEQAAAVFAAKKAKLQKEVPPAPSESEIDLGVFSGGRGNLLEEIYAASAPLPVSKTSKKPRAADISRITPPTSPPSRTVGLTPPRDGADANVGGGEGFVEGTFEGGDATGGDVGGDVGGDKGKGVEVQMESSETTPQQTIYTKRPPGEGGATSGFVRSPHFEHNPDDSWGNPACDDLPHVPRWSLTQGSRMTDLKNCHEFFSLSLPPAERMLQKNRNRFALIDDHVSAGVHFFATSQEILREWRSMGEETLEFEEAKKSFSEEKEKFNAERKGLQWRVAEAERKLEEQKQLNEQKQKDWESACARTNLEMQSQRDAIVRLSGEKTALADEAHQARLAAEKKEKEYVARIDKLELLAQEKAAECETVQRLLDEKTAECRASELLAEEASADSRWLLSRGVPLLADRILHSSELARYMFELGRAGYNSGRKFGYAEGKLAATNNERDSHFELYKDDCDGAYAEKRKEFSTLDFSCCSGLWEVGSQSKWSSFVEKSFGRRWRWCCRGCCRRCWLQPYLIGSFRPACRVWP